MTPEALQKELRRILKTQSITVKKDPAWAAANGHHPHALQVWDKGVVSGEPYIVAVLERNGVPHEPGPLFFQRLWEMHADNVHRGRKGWAEKMRFDARDRQEFEERKHSERLRERLESQRGKAMSLLGCGKYWSLNRSMIPDGAR